MLDLSEILVVSIENAVAAPMCSMRFADAGARVIKIEPSGGETARNYDDTVLGESGEPYTSPNTRSSPLTVVPSDSPTDFLST